MENYFENDGYVTRTMLHRLKENPYLFSLWYKGLYVYDETPEMRLGSIAHDELFYRLDNAYKKEYAYTIVDDFKLNTKKGKEYYQETIVKGGMEHWVKISDYNNLIAHLDTITKDDIFIEYINDLKKEYTLSFEEVFYGELFGVPVKIKVDIVCYDFMGEIAKIVDYKTTSDVHRFKHSVYKYSYDIQAAMYSSLLGLRLTDSTFDFLVSDKTRNIVKIFKTDRKEFAISARNNFKNILHKYTLWKNGKHLEFGIETL